MSLPEPPPRLRLAALDGLRGLAIVLVVMSHGWLLWPIGWIDGHAWIRPLFRNGNSGVTIFLVAAGFLTYRVLAHHEEGDAMRPGVVTLRRVLRVGPAMWVMLLAVLVMAAVDPTDKATKAITRESSVHVLTYTFNWYVQNDFLGTRPDLGHLWYVSVDMQAFAVVAILMFFLRHRPAVFLATLSVLYVVLVAWRFHAYGTENVWVVFNRTTVRMDAFVLGALTGAVSALLPRSHRSYRLVAAGSLFALVPVLFWSDVDASYMGWAGTLLQIVVATYILTSTLVPRHPWQLTTWRPLVMLGRLSLVIYIWHFPIFHFVRRHSTEWDWPWRVVVAILATVVAAWLCYLLVERPVARALAHPRWAEARSQGLVPYAVTAVRRRAGSARATHTGNRTSVP